MAIANSCHAAQCDGARPTCDRCESRGSSSPCQYEKLHHVKSLREEISELQAELSEAKGGLPAIPEAASASQLLRRDSHETATSQVEAGTVTSHRYLPQGDHQSQNRLHEEPHRSTTSLASQMCPLTTDSSSTVGLEVKGVAYGNDASHGYLTQSSILPNKWESSHKMQPQSTCAQT